MKVQAYKSFFGLRLTETERAVLERLAAMHNTTPSAYIRDRLLQEAVRPLFEGQAHDGHEAA